MDGLPLNRFIQAARQTSLGAPRQRFVESARPVTRSGGETLPGGVLLEQESALGRPHVFMLEVAQEILDRRGMPKGGDYDLAANSLAGSLLRGYTPAAQRAMDFTTWVKRLFAIPPHLTKREDVRDVIVAFLAGSLVQELLQAVEALRAEEQADRYIEGEDDPEDDEESEETTADPEPVQPRRVMVPRPSGAVGPPRADLTQSGSEPSRTTRVQAGNRPPGILRPASATGGLNLRNFEAVSRELRRVLGGSPQVSRRAAAGAALRPDLEEALDVETWLRRYLLALVVANLPAGPFEVTPTDEDGRRVHLVLQEHYRRLFRPFNDVVIERRAYRLGPLDQGQTLSLLAVEQPLSRYAALHTALANVRGEARLKMDVADFSLGELYEVKPRRSAHRAVTQIWRYQVLFNAQAYLFGIPQFLSAGDTWNPFLAIPLGRMLGGRRRVAQTFVLPGLPGLVLYVVNILPNEAEEDRARRVAIRRAEEELANKVFTMLIVIAMTTALALITAGLSIYLSGVAIAAETAAAAGATVIPITAAAAETAAATAVVETIAKAAMIAWFLLDKDPSQADTGDDLSL